MNKLTKFLGLPLFTSGHDWLARHYNESMEKIDKKVEELSEGGSGGGPTNLLKGYEAVRVSPASDYGWIQQLELYETDEKYEFSFVFVGNNPPASQSYRFKIENFPLSASIFRSDRYGFMETCASIGNQQSFNTVVIGTVKTSMSISIQLSDKTASTSYTRFHFVKYKN